MLNDNTDIKKNEKAALSFCFHLLTLLRFINLIFIIILSFRKFPEILPELVQLWPLQLRKLLHPEAHKGMTYAIMVF